MKDNIISKIQIQIINFNKKSNMIMKLDKILQTQDFTRFQIVHQLNITLINNILIIMRYILF